MNLNFRNSMIITVITVIAVAAIIFGPALIAGAQSPAATGGCGMQGASQSGQGCSMMGGSGSQSCPMSKGGVMMGMMNCGSGCTTLSGKVVSVGRDGTLTVKVKPAANTPDAAKKAIAQLRSGDDISLMMMTGQTRSSTTTGTTQKATKYTCPMHPEVVSDKPGQCPKCGMNLEPVNPQGK